MTSLLKKIYISVGILIVCLCAGMYIARAATMSTSPLNSLATGLVGFWTFDGPNMISNVKDSSGQGNNGYMTGFAATSSAVVVGKTGQGLKFDGVDDYVQVPSSGSLPAEQPMSISIWLKPNNATASFVLASRPFSGNGWNITYAFGNRMLFQHDGVSDLSARTNSNFGAFSTTQWTHIVVTWDGTTDATHALIYKNGVVQPHDTDTNGTSLTSTVGQILYLTSDQGGSGFYSGSMDDFRMYNRVLTTSEINQLYLMGTKQAVSPQITASTSCATGLSCGLLGYWTFDGKDTPWTSSSAGTTLDKSGNGRTGTLSGMNQSFNPIAGKIGQALRLDGSNDCITTASEFVGTSAASVSFWSYRVNPNDFGYYFYNGKLNIQAFDAERIAITNNGSTQVTSSSNAFRAGVWTHIVATRDASGNSVLYANGVSVGSGSGGTPAVGNVNVRFSGNDVCGQNAKGVIDDMRVYNRALSASEVGQLYNISVATKQAASPWLSNTSSCTAGLSCGLVGYWTFDGKDVNWSTGTLIDKSGNSNTANILNMSTTSSPFQGKVGQAFRFDGVNDVVNAGSSASLTDIQSQGGGGMTVAFWVNPNSNATRYLVAKGGGNNGSGSWSILKASNTDPARLSFNKEGATDSTKNYNSLLTSGVWQHIVLTWNGSMTVSTGVLVYKNGVLVSNVTGTDGVTANSDSGSSLCIGSLSNIGIAGCSGSSPADAKMDDVRIYNRVLSATEVLQLYNMSK